MAIICFCQEAENLFFSTKLNIIYRSVNIFLETDLFHCCVPTQHHHQPTHPLLHIHLLLACVRPHQLPLLSPCPRLPSTPRLPHLFLPLPP
jgi:hypothetical protein